MKLNEFFFLSIFYFLKMREADGGIVWGQICTLDDMRDFNIRIIKIIFVFVT